MPPPNPMLVFDRRQVRRQRNRAAPHFAAHNVLCAEVAGQLRERVKDVARPFPAVLELGRRDGTLSEYFVQNPDRLVVIGDYAGEMLRSLSVGVPVVCDEEYLPFATRCFDLVISNLHLHWVNDLPGTLLQIRQALRPDGLFLASILGGTTLQELRTCLLDAELAVMGGVSPRLSPVLDLPTATALIQRAGFVLPVVDEEHYTFIYEDAFALMRDLRAMGEGNAHHERLRHTTRRTVLLEAARLYQERFGRPQGGVEANFNVLYWHGWTSSA